MNRDSSLAEKISLVIIARNRAAALETSLRKLSSLPERVPIIVVDNHSEDGTPQMVRAKFPEVALLSLPENCGSAGRNRGVEHARTPYIAFADDDSWWESGALGRAVTCFEQYPRLGLIQAKILLHGERVEPTCQLMARSPVTTPPDCPGKCILGFVACGTIVRKDAFLAAGGFHRCFGVGGEEELIALDMAGRGWLLAYMPDILAFHSPSPIRDKTRRKQLAVRNHLWSVWLRRPLNSVLDETSPFLKKALTDCDVRQGVLEALAGLSWVLKERKPVSPDLEQEVAKLKA